MVIHRCHWQYPFYPSLHMCLKTKNGIAYQSLSEQRREKGGMTRPRDKQQTHVMNRRTSTCNMNRAINTCHMNRKTIY